MKDLNYLVYLSSTTYHWWNFRSYRWKNKLIEEILKYNKDITFIDPLTFKSEDPKVCPLDIKDINRSKYVVVYIDKLSIGTLLELGYCSFCRKNNWCVLSFNKNVLMHPWIRYLCKDRMYDSYAKVSYSIIKHYNELENSDGYWS